MARWLVVVLVAGACGRLGFDEHRGGGGPTDSLAAGDAPSTTDGRPADAAARDATPDAAPSCAMTRQICETFEAPNIDTSVWAYTAGVSLDSSVAHRGGQSLRVQSTALAPGTSGYFVLSEDKTLAAQTAGTFYVRAWVRLGALPAGTNGMELISPTRAPGRCTATSCSCDRPSSRSTASSPSRRPAPASCRRPARGSARCGR